MFHLKLIRIFISSRVHLNPKTISHSRCGVGYREEGTRGNRGAKEKRADQESENRGQK